MTKQHGGTEDMKEEQVEREIKMKQKTEQRIEGF